MRSIIFQSDRHFLIFSYYLEGEFDFSRQNQPANNAKPAPYQQNQPNRFQAPNRINQLPPQSLQQQQAFPRPQFGMQQQRPQQPQQTSLSLEQVEAQLRGGGPNMGAIPPPIMPQQSMQPIFGRPPSVGQNQMMGLPGAYNQPQFRAGNQMFFNQQQQQQQFMMRPGGNLMQPFNPQVHPPSMKPAPIVIDGISVTPVEITNQEKDAVFAKVCVLIGN